MNEVSQVCVHCRLFSFTLFYIQVLVTEVTPEGHFFAQHVDEGPKLEQLMKQIREEFIANPPLTGAYQPRKGDIFLIVAKISIETCTC